MKVNSYTGATLCHTMYSKQKESKEIRSKSIDLLPVRRKTANTITLFFHPKLHLKKVANAKYQWKVFITWISQAFTIINRHLVQTYKYMLTKEKYIVIKEISEHKTIIFSVHLTPQDN